jgi:hypothetical protein
MVDRKDRFVIPVSVPVALPPGRSGSLTWQQLEDSFDELFSYTEDMGDGRPTWTISGAIDAQDQVHLTDIHIRKSEGGQDLSRRDLLRLRDLDQVVHELARAIVERSIPAASAWQMKPSATGDPIEAGGLRKRTRRVVDADFLDTVAAVYTEHKASGAPVRAIMHEIGCTERTAFRYVKRAREQGHLAQEGDL